MKAVLTSPWTYFEDDSSPRRSNRNLGRTGLTDDHCRHGWGVAGAGRTPHLAEASGEILCGSISVVGSKRHSGITGSWQFSCFHGCDGNDEVVLR